MISVYLLLDFGMILFLFYSCFSIIPNRSLENLAFTLLEIRCNYDNN